MNTNTILLICVFFIFIVVINSDNKLKKVGTRLCTDGRNNTRLLPRNTPEECWEAAQEVDNCQSGVIAFGQGSRMGECWCDQPSESDINDSKCRRKTGTNKYNGYIRYKK